MTTSSTPYGTTTPILPGYALILGTGEADTLQGHAAAAEIIAGMGGDSVFGGGGDDIIYGGAGSSFMGGRMAYANAADGNDLLNGGGGNDLLDGGGGRDTLRGGSGDDTLIGGSGADLLFGGAGHDRFLFGLTPLGPDTGLGKERDVIADFHQGEDLIDLIGYRGDLRTPEEALALLGVGPLAAMAHGAIRWEIRGGNTLIQLDLDLPGQHADGVADAEILLRGIIPLTAADFVL